MSKFIKKLGSDKTYKRPIRTFQEQLSGEDIMKKLQGYERVDNISEIPLNTHMRYFKTNPDGTQIFRTGGFLYNKQDSEKFIILTNWKNTWSVQIKDTVFFKKMSHKDEINAIHELYRAQLEEKDIVIEKLKKYIQDKIPKFDPQIIIDKKKYKKNSKLNNVINEDSQIILENSKYGEVIHKKKI
jgi:hypothetical protein